MICFYSFTKRFSKGNACKFCPTERCPTRCWVLAPSSYAGRWQQALPRRPSVPGWHKGTLFHIGQSDLSMFYRNSLLSPFIDGVKAGLYSDSSLEPFGKGSSMRRSLLETCWGSPVVQGTMLCREVAAPWLNTAAEVFFSVPLWAHTCIGCDMVLGLQTSSHICGLHLQRGFSVQWASQKMPHVKCIFLPVGVGVFASCPDCKTLHQWWDKD